MEEHIELHELHDRDIVGKMLSVENSIGQMIQFLKKISKDRGDIYKHLSDISNKDNVWTLLGSILIQNYKSMYSKCETFGISALHN